MIPIYIYITYILEVHSCYRAQCSNNLKINDGYYHRYLQRHCAPFRALRKSFLYDFRLSSVSDNGGAGSSVAKRATFLCTHSGDPPSPPLPTTPSQLSEALALYLQTEQLLLRPSSVRLSGVEQLLPMPSSVRLIGEGSLLVSVGEGGCGE